jgi:SAM-dependent methyltransferase
VQADPLGRARQRQPVEDLTRPVAEQVEVVGLSREAVAGDDHVPAGDEGARVRHEGRAPPEDPAGLDVDGGDVRVAAPRGGCVRQVPVLDVEDVALLARPGDVLEPGPVRRPPEPAEVECMASAHEIAAAVDEEESAGQLLPDGKLEVGSAEAPGHGLWQRREGREICRRVVARGHELEPRATRAGLARRTWKGRSRDNDDVRLRSGRGDQHEPDENDRERPHAGTIRSRFVVVNRDPNARGPYTAFADVADAYERGRPEYPEDAVRWLAGDEPRDVVDLGAGTGKLTRALVSLGHRVTAIEPLPEMLEHLPEAAPGAYAILGSAEVIPLPDEHADVVTCAQSFHWFDHAVALPEIARVLRPGGRLAFVWNTRDDREPWVARLSKLIGSETISREESSAPVEHSGIFGTVETAEFAIEQRLDRERLLDLVLSRSYCAKLPPAEREPILRAVGELYDELADPDGIRLPYVTECFRAEKLA